MSEDIINSVLLKIVIDNGWEEWIKAGFGVEQTFSQIISEETGFRSKILDEFELQQSGEKKWITEWRKLGIKDEIIYEEIIFNLANKGNKEPNYLGTRKHLRNVAYQLMLRSEYYDDCEQMCTDILYGVSFEEFISHLMLTSTGVEKCLKTCEKLNQPVFGKSVLHPLNYLSGLYYYFQVHHSNATKTNHLSGEYDSTKFYVSENDNIQIEKYQTHVLTNTDTTVGLSILDRYDFYKWASFPAEFNSRYIAGKILRYLMSNKLIEEIFYKLKRFNLFFTICEECIEVCKERVEESTKNKDGVRKITSVELLAHCREILVNYIWDIGFHIVVCDCCGEIIY